MHVILSNVDLEICIVIFLLQSDFFLKDFKICYSRRLFTDEYDLLKRLYGQIYVHYLFFDYIISFHTRVIRYNDTGKQVN